MIKDLFIPEKIDGYYLLKKEILGVSINKTHVRATLVAATGKTLAIKEYFEEPLGTNSELSYQERVTLALTSIKAKVSKNVSIRSALSSSFITFKQLKLPFTDHEKIKMVLPFEIAPQLPFSLESAIIDFIITEVNPERTESTIMVAAVQKEHIDQHVALFTAAQIPLDAITVDLFDIYGLYLMIPAYSARKGGTVLLDLQPNSTRLLYIVDTKLERIRTIGQGVTHLIKAIGQELNIENGEALEQVMRFGASQHTQNNYTHAIEQAIESLWQSVQFTLNSFADQTTKPIDTLLLLGSFSTLPGMAAYIEKKSTIPCIPFNAELLFENSHITATHKTITPDQIASLSTALANPTTSECNLLQEEFAPQTTRLFTQQLITAGILILLLIGSFLAISIWQTSKLKKHERQARQAALIHLQELGLVDEDVTNLTEAVEDAQTKVNKKEAQWFPFSRQARTSLLYILQTLSSSIDRESIGLQLKRLFITEDQVHIEGSVKSFDALDTLQKELERSKLFKYVPREEFQDTTFNVKLALKKNKKGVL